MNEAPPTRVEKLLDLDYSETDKIWLSGQKSLRKLVGILGVALPVLLYLFLWIDTGYRHPLESISHYYMTRASSVFVIVVSLLAIFLLVYKGKALADFILSFFAGVFALCLILFPTSNITDVCGDKEKIYSVTMLKLSPFRVHLHYAAAAIFLLCLAAISFFIFTRSDRTPEKRTVQKRRRNRLYRVCAVIMVLAIGVIAAGLFGLIPTSVYDGNHLTFWMETVAIESFGLSWLVKGEMFLKDK